MSQKNNSEKCFNKFMTMLVVIEFIIILCLIFVNSNDASLNSNVSLSSNDIYDMVSNLYNEAIEFNYSTVPSKFEVGEMTEDYYVEILNYDEVMNSLFTDDAIKAWEENYKDAIKKEEGKVYVMQADGVIGLDYATQAFIKFEVTDDTIKCVVDNIFFDDNYDEELPYPNLVHFETPFELKKVDGKWLVNKIERTR